MVITFAPAQGDSITLTDPYKVMSTSGFGTPQSTEDMVSSPYRDGAFFISQRLEPRYMFIGVTVKTTSFTDQWDKRRLLIDAFNNRIGIGLLTVTLPDTTVYTIEALSKGVDFAHSNIPMLIKCVISLVAPGAYWQDSLGEDVIGI